MRGCRKRPRLGTSGRRRIGFGRASQHAGGGGGGGGEDVRVAAAGRPFRAWFRARRPRERCVTSRANSRTRGEKRRRRGGGRGRRKALARRERGGAGAAQWARGGASRLQAAALGKVGRCVHPRRLIARQPDGDQTVAPNDATKLVLPPRHRRAHRQAEAALRRRLAAARAAARRAMDLGAGRERAARESARRELVAVRLAQHIAEQGAAGAADGAAHR
mmetsp:Transcript_40172/g.93747  ORF Transcript_40172/g.93747 Transcript_40172/m.93747 type:complete len:219 (+) Transcript_40172:115-771(+)